MRAADSLNTMGRSVVTV